MVSRAITDDDRAFPSRPTWRLAVSLLTTELRHGKFSKSTLAGLRMFAGNAVSFAQRWAIATVTCWYHPMITIIPLYDFRRTAQRMSPAMK